MLYAVSGYGARFCLRALRGLSALVVGSGLEPGSATGSSTGFAAVFAGFFATFTLAFGLFFGTLLVVAGVLSLPFPVDAAALCAATRSLCLWGLIGRCDPPSAAWTTTSGRQRTPFT